LKVLVQCQFQTKESRKRKRLKLQGSLTKTNMKWIQNLHLIQRQTIMRLALVRVMNHLSPTARTYKSINPKRTPCLSLTLQITSACWNNFLNYPVEIWLVSLTMEMISTMKMLQRRATMTWICCERFKV
jgi:hypothetical protein